MTHKHQTTGEELEDSHLIDVDEQQRMLKWLARYLKDRLQIDEFYMESEDVTKLKEAIVTIQQLVDDDDSVVKARL